VLALPSGFQGDEAGKSGHIRTMSSVQHLRVVLTLHAAAFS
jgi:hypothetical protein